MNICPKCRGLYQDTDTICQECNIKLMNKDFFQQVYYEFEDMNKKQKLKHRFNERYETICKYHFSNIYNYEQEQTTKNEIAQTEQAPSPTSSEFDNTTWYSIFTDVSLIVSFIVFYQLAWKRDHILLGTFLTIMILLLWRYLCARLAPNTSKFIDEQIKEDRNSKNNRMCNPGLKCPLCGSHYVVKIGALDRAASVHFWGLASDKIGKQYECKDCRHKF